MPYKSSSAASDASLAPFGLRILRAMQPSAARGEAAEYVAEQLYAGNRLRRVHFAQSGTESRLAVVVSAIDRGLLAGAARVMRLLEFR
jgi:hypothetical protein